MVSFTGFKEEFLSQCQRTLSEVGVEDMRIEERSVNKSQRGTLNGMVFIKEGLNCAPTLYVEDFYSAYRNGSSIRDLSREAIDTVVRGMDMAGLLAVNTDALITDYGNLRVRLLNKVINRDYLRNMPSKEVGCGLVFIAEFEFGEYRAVINNDLLNSMTISKEELFEIALNNTIENYPAMLCSLSDSLCVDEEDRENLLESESKRAPLEAGPGFVLTNSRFYWGAGALFYPGVIERIHELLDDDFYVLPSSVHELILVGADGQDPYSLIEMLQEANRTVVEEKDILSDDLYICESGEFKRVSYGGEVRESMNEYLN